jgi:hypothetical protein
VTGRNCTQYIGIGWKFASVITILNFLNFFESSLVEIIDIDWYLAFDLVTLRKEAQFWERKAEQRNGHQFTPKRALTVFPTLNRTSAPVT